jgi:hypothetical protein
VEALCRAEHLSWEAVSHHDVITDADGVHAADYTPLGARPNLLAT